MADSPELMAAKQLLDLAKSQGFAFQRVAPGPDGPLLGRREGIGYPGRDLPERVLGAEVVHRYPTAPVIAGGVLRVARG